jgi:integrase
MPILSERISGRFPDEPAVTSPNGSLLGLENWKRSTRWRNAIVEIGRPSLRVHGLRHTYASLARRAGADLRLLQKTMGHASITVTAHVYADSVRRRTRRHRLGPRCPRRCTRRPSVIGWPDIGRMKSTSAEPIARI